MALLVEKRSDWPTTFMDMLEVLRGRSCCLKIRTTAMIVNDTQIISIGYNGTFSGFDECDVVWKKYWLDNVKQGIDELK